MTPKANLISAEGAAALLGYHPEHVRRLARQGRIPALKVGAWVFDPDELRAWQREKQQVPEGKE